MPSKPGMRNRRRHTLPAKYGEDFVTRLDARYRLGREVHRRLQALMSDLGGEAALSHAQRSLCERATWLELAIQHEEMRLGSGSGIDIGPHTQLVNTLVGLYKTIGIKRAAREARLSDYLEAHRTPRKEGAKISQTL
jgi:hypothetical protein